MIALLKWAWTECSTLDFILLVTGLIVFILIMVAILISLYLQNEDLIQMKVLLWAVAVSEALEAFDSILHDEIGQLPPGYTFYDEELWEISKTEHEMKREARAERKRKKKMKKLRAKIRAAEKANPAHGYRDLETFIESCSRDEESEIKWQEKRETPDGRKSQHKQGNQKSPHMPGKTGRARP